MKIFKCSLKRALCASLLSSCVVVQAATSDDARANALAKQNACLGCHALDKKVVGPSFQDVAKRYVNSPNAVALLKNKIAKGGSGSWGVVPMPGNSKLSDIELSLLANWVLRGAPKAN